MEQAKTYTSESRGAWKAVTGEVYGSDKAEGWMVTIPALDDGIPEVSQEDLTQAQSEHAKAVEEIGRGDQHLGGLRAKRDTAASMTM